MGTRLPRWLQLLFVPTRAHRRSRDRRGFRPFLEELEVRWLPTSYVVNTNLDILGDTTPGQVTLRDALTAISTGHASGQAAAGTTSNTIQFAIPGTGPQTLNVGGNGPLPAITHQVFLDGWSQGGPTYNGPPLIVLNGGENGGDGLTLSTGSNGSTVRGLVVEDFAGNGIVLNGSSRNLLAGNYVGVDAAGDNSPVGNVVGIVLENGATANTIGGITTRTINLISDNYEGLEIKGRGTSGNVVLGNFIGTDVHGTAILGNNIAGVLIDSGATANTVGGSAAGAANVISANLYDGVRLSDSGTSGNVVLGNKIGTDVYGTANLGNHIGGVDIRNGATANTVGGTAAVAANVISANNDGVDLNGGGTSGNVVLGNKIGTDVNGTSNLGNSSEGVFIGFSASGNTVGGTAAGAANVISANGDDGVYLGLFSVPLAGMQVPAISVSGCQPA